METRWHYGQNGQQNGPVSTDELKQLAASGRLQREDLVWHEGMAEWTPAANVPELSFSGAPATPQAVQPAGVVPVSPGGQPLSYAAPGLGPVMLTPRGMEMLRQTKPWARLFSVLLFIGAAIILLTAVVPIVAGVFLPGSGMQGVGAGIFSGILLAAGALLYLFPAIFLSRYASRIGDLMDQARTDHLDAALEAQKSFWKFIGILTAIYLSFVAVLLVIMCAGGFIGGMSSRGF